MDEKVKIHAWNTNISFLGSNSLAMGTGAVSLGGAGTSRSVNVPANPPTTTLIFEWKQRHQIV